MSTPEDLVPDAGDVDRPMGSLDEEGIPDHEGPLAAKEATGDGQEGLIAPGDVPWASDRDDVTATGQRAGHTLDERLAAEEPDRMVARDDPAPELLDEDRPDDEPDLVGSVGDERGVSAEELAVHVTTDPPGATDDDDDGYVAEDGGMAP